MVDTSDKLLREQEYTDEFKREAVGLLARQIASACGSLLLEERAPDEVTRKGMVDA